MSKKRSKRNTKASLKALQAKRKTYSKGSRVKKAPGGFSMTPEMLEAIQANPSGTKGGPSAGIDPAIAGRVYGQNKEKDNTSEIQARGSASTPKQPPRTGTVKTPDPAAMIDPTTGMDLRSSEYAQYIADQRNAAVAAKNKNSLLASATPSTGTSFSSQEAIDAKAQDKLANENYFKNLPEIEKRRKSPEFLTLENKVIAMGDKLGSKAYEDIEFRLLTRKLGRMAGVDDNGNLFPAESEAQARAAIAASDSAAEVTATRGEPLPTGRAPSANNPPADYNAGPPPSHIFVPYGNIGWIKNSSSTVDPVMGGGGGGGNNNDDNDGEGGKKFPSQTETGRVTNEDGSVTITYQDGSTKVIPFGKDLGSIDVTQETETDSPRIEITPPASPELTDVEVQTLRRPVAVLDSEGNPTFDAEGNPITRMEVPADTLTGDDDIKKIGDTEKAVAGNVNIIAKEERVQLYSSKLADRLKEDFPDMSNTDYTLLKDYIQRVSVDRNAEWPQGLSLKYTNTFQQALGDVGTFKDFNPIRDRSISQTDGVTTTATLKNKFKQDEAGNALANTYTADTATAASMTAAQGELSPGSTAEAARADFTDANRVDTATRDSAQEQAALAQNAQFREDSRSQAGEVSFREDVDVSPTPEAEFRTRDAITDDTFAEREAAQIIDKVGFEAAKRRTVTGEAAKGAAATMLEQVGELPPEITAAIVEDPATVTAKVDNEPVEVQAAIAALPTEALVSSQMETLLAGMDDGNTPAWARPAVAQVEAMLAQRGLSASTVARDSLFNAIVQTALPMAQSNAQALQTRAAQNLSNEQQANMSAATLDMQRRMANLSNQQTAESQTAQMAQQMSTLQSQYRQDAVMTTAQLQQQTRVQNLANQQETAKINAANQQQINAQELGNAQQIELAEMQYMNATESENMSAEQQQRLTDFQVAADFLAKNAGFKQQMDMANMSNQQQSRLATLTALNKAGADNLTAAQQIELANLNTALQTNLTQAKIEEAMGVAQLSVDQQRALTNAATVAKIDLTKFTTEQQVELTNSKFMQTATLTDYSARQQSAIQNATTMAQMDMQAADLLTKTRISNAQNFLQMDLANLNNRQQEQVINAQMEQQTRLSNQAATNAAKQFNSASQNQVDQFMTQQANVTEQFNSAQSAAMSQFNATEKNKIAAINANNTLEADRLNAQLETQVSTFNAEIDFKQASWNTANAQAVDQANIEWKRNSNTIDTAAQNAANGVNAQMAYNLTMAEQNSLWQNLRDEAAYIRTAYESLEQRKTVMLSTALQNETAAGKENNTTTAQLIRLVADLFND